MAVLGILESTCRRAGRMAAAPLAAGLFCLSLVGGCRHLDSAQVDVLERELRQQEDYIYELEDYLIEYSEKLRQARMAQCQDGTTVTPKSTQSKRAIPQGTLDQDLPVTPRLPLDGRDHVPADAGSPSIVPPASSSAAPSTSSAIEAEKSITPSTPAPATTPGPTPAPAEKTRPEDMEAPPLEIGPGASLPWRKAGRIARSRKRPQVSANSPLAIPDPVDYELGDDARESSVLKKTQDASTLPAVAEDAAEPDLAPPKQNAPRLAAEKLQIRRILRQASDEPGTPPGSLLVVVEALNATDEPADASGEIAVMVRPKDAPPSARPIETWTFSAEETKAAWQSSPLGDGLHLELPLGKTKESAGDVELWARLVCPDGRKLLAKVPFDPLQLATIEEAAEEARLAAAEEPAKPPVAAHSGEADIAPNSDEAVASADRAEPAAKKKPTWRASDTKLNANRVEGFATTAGGKSDGWAKQPTGAVRVATAIDSSPSSSKKPTWQRSSSASTQGGIAESWTPER